MGLGKEYYLSSAWDYWQPGCLSRSTDRFRKFFHMGRDRFEDIYSKAAHSDLFHLNPLDPMYVGPIFPGAHNDKTMVRYDKLVDSMCDEPLFKERHWQTCATGADGGNTVLTG